MANMIYNGLVLPPLPPELDLTAYPYLYIHQSGFATELLAFSEPMRNIPVSGSDGYLSTGYGGTPSAFACDVIVVNGLPDTDYWTNQRTLEVPFGYLTAHGCLWSNTDIYNEDGTLFRAADSTPIPCTSFPADFDPRSFAYGMRVGAVIRSLRGKAKEKEYTHYSYNGTVLPKLPELVYPYAFIRKYTDSSTGESKYILNVSSGPLTYNVTALYGFHIDAPFLHYNIVGDKWGLAGAYDEPTFFVINNNAAVWANHDIADVVHGGVYLSASDPVEVI